MMLKADQGYSHFELEWEDQLKSQVKHSSCEVKELSKVIFFSVDRKTCNWVISSFLKAEE